MIDYVKIFVKNADVQRLLHVPYLNFKGEYSETSGEIGCMLKSDYHFCMLKINKSGLFFTGSIHKLWNSLHAVNAPNYNQKKERAYKGYNGNQFTFSKIVEVRDHLAQLFDCEPYQMILQNVEVGVNTTPDFPPKQYLDGLLSHGGQPFDTMWKGNYRQVAHQQYYLKIYNKSYQYQMQEKTLRVEIKIVKSVILRRLGIYSFADITPESLRRCEKMLLEVFNKTLHYDYTLQKESLSERQKRMLDKYANPNYWLNELPTIRQDYHRKKLQDFTVKYSDNLHRKIAEGIRQKFVKINRLNEQKNDTNSQAYKKEKFVIINSSDIGVVLTSSLPSKKKQKCLVTGLNISMQKEDSFLLSHTGLKWYLKHDRKEYEKVARKYLSEKWQSANLKEQIKELAHNIRNYHNNRKLKQLKIYPKEQYRLFEVG